MNNDIEKYIYNTLLEDVKESFINESNISRLEKYIISKHDICIITGWRNVIKDLNGEEDEDVMKFYEPINDDNGVDSSKKLHPNKHNKRRWNRIICDTLRYLGAGVTSVYGFFSELQSSNKEEYPDIEESLFCVNLEDNEDFIETCIKLGKRFNQNSVLIKEAGSDEAYLYGTNYVSDNNPDEEEYNPRYNKKKNLGSFRKNVWAMCKTQIDGHSFAFSKYKEDDEEQHLEDLKQFAYKKRKELRKQKNDHLNSGNIKKAEEERLKQEILKKNELPENYKDKSLDDLILIESLQLYTRKKVPCSSISNRTNLLGIEAGKRMYEELKKLK